MPLLLSLTLGYSLTSHAATPDTSPRSFKQKTMKIKIKINRQLFDIVLSDNQTAKAFAEKLLLMLEMEELNGNEKFADISQTLAINPERPDMIHNGDLMPYGSKTLALFYSTFELLYQYTPIGKIIEPDNPAKIAGRKNRGIEFLQPWILFMSLSFPDYCLLAVLPQQRRDNASCQR